MLGSTFKDSAWDIYFFPSLCRLSNRPTSRNVSFSTPCHYLIFLGSKIFVDINQSDKHHIFQTQTIWSIIQNQKDRLVGQWQHQVLIIYVIMLTESIWGLCDGIGSFIDQTVQLICGNSSEHWKHVETRGNIFSSSAADNVIMLFKILNNLR